MQANLVHEKTTKIFFLPVIFNLLTSKEVTFLFSEEKKALRSRSSAGLLLIGCVGSLFSAMFFTLSACYAENKSKKCAFLTIKRNVVATLLQAVNGTSIEFTKIER